MTWTAKDNRRQRAWRKRNPKRMEEYKKQMRDRYANDPAYRKANNDRGKETSRRRYHGDSKYRKKVLAQGRAYKKRNAAKIKKQKKEYYERKK